MKRSGPRPTRVGPFTDGVVRCECCARVDPASDEGYTKCCNELLDYGDGLGRAHRIVNFRNGYEEVPEVS